jgi:hypothetical protein
MRSKSEVFNFSLVIGIQNGDSVNNSKLETIVHYVIILINK